MGDRVPPWPASYPLSVGDVLHLIPVADLLSSGPEEWQQQKKMFLHMEHLEESKPVCRGFSMFFNQRSYLWLEFICVQESDSTCHYCSTAAPRRI